MPNWNQHRPKPNSATCLVLVALALCVTAATWGGCGPGPASVVDHEQPSEADGLLKINYRGQVRIAERRKGLVFIEGDIEVAPQELQVLSAETQGVVGKVEQASRIQGAYYRWPDSVVPFEFDSSLSAAQRTSIERAMDDWQEVAPGLRFVERTSGNASAYPDYVRFLLYTVCSSSMGRVGGLQYIRLTNGCINSFSVHHEIGHALGLYHQHTRKDRDSYVQINWHNIRGCPDTATQHSDCGGCSADPAACGCTEAQVNAGTCNRSHNFASNTSRADLGSYDYDSMMHYPTHGFSKNGGATITVLHTDPATGSPYSIGQRSHLSAGDIGDMRTMYPDLRTHRVVFHDTGKQKVCFLEGREQDVASRHELHRPWHFWTWIQVAPGGEINTSSYPEGDHTFDDCVIRSVFWGENYDYPNTTQTFPSGAYNSSAESHSHGSFNVRVLNRGLLAVVTSIM